MSRRGGARVGAGGPSRTTLPATAASGQPYGMAGTQLQAQKQIPMAAGPQLPPGPATPPQAPQGPPPGPLTPGTNPDLDAIMSRLRPLSGPTSTPNVPMTHGLASGPGAGPEVFTPALPSTTVSVLAALNRLPAGQDTGQTAALRAALAASQTNAVPQ